MERQVWLPLTFYAFGPNRAAHAMLSKSRYRFARLNASTTAFRHPSPIADISLRLNAMQFACIAPCYLPGPNANTFSRGVASTGDEQTEKHNPMKKQ